MKNTVKTCSQSEKVQTKMSSQTRYIETYTSYLKYKKDKQISLTISLCSYPEYKII